MRRRESSRSRAFWPAFIGAVAALAGCGLLIDTEGSSTDALAAAPWLALASLMGAWLGHILAEASP